ncbi:MAG: hypothetical protein U9R69_10810, partial [Thermodesulfobacteriota bacterium]|nr:hypothetical protein [Thermodesulfobacteriota bacterium]
WQALRSASYKYLLSFFVGKCFYHDLNVSCHVTIVKQSLQINSSAAFVLFNGKKTDREAFSNQPISPPKPAKNLDFQSWWC